MTDFVHTFSFDAECGTFTVASGGGLAIAGASLQIILGDRTLDSVLLDVAGTARRDEDRPGLGGGVAETIRFAADEGVAVTLEAFVPDSGECVVLRTELANERDAAIAVETLQPLVLEGEEGFVRLGVPSSQWAVYREGWHSGSPTGVLSITESNFGAAGARDEGITSDLVTVLVAGEVDRALLLGWLEARRLTNRFLVARQGDGATLRAVASADGVPLGPGATLASEPLMVRFAADPLRALEHYGDLFGTRMASRTLRGIPATADNDSNGGTETAPSLSPSGWGSRDIAPPVTDAMIRENLAAYTPEADRWQLDYWIIDDGWQSVAGDWLIINEKRFPLGMKLVADAIGMADLKPGLSLSPLLVSEASVLAREHVDWLLRDERDEAVVAIEFPEESYWRGRQLVLDVTRPEAADHLRTVIRTVVRDWGFACVKADFLFAGALPGKRHDPTVTATQAMRRALEILRDEVGQRFLLACACPIGPATGLVDACRTGPDAAGRWHDADQNPDAPSTKNAIGNVIARYWQHGRLFVAAPGALMTRQKAGGLIPEEAQTLATVIAMSGGLTMGADQFDAMSPDRQTFIDMILPACPRAARPVDLFRHPLSETLVWDIDRGALSWKVVALLNQSDLPADLSLEFGNVGCDADRPYHVLDLWQPRYYGVATGSLIVPSVPGHGVRLLVVRPEGSGLDFLGSTLHATGGAVFCDVEASGLACDVRLDARWPRCGRLFFCPPAGYVVRTSDGLLTPRDDGAWSIEVDTSMTTEYHFEAVHQQG